MKQVQIVSTGSYLPGDPLTNEDIERLVGPLPADVLEGIQVKRRHWMIDPATGEHRINNSEMALEAAPAAPPTPGGGPARGEAPGPSTARPDQPLPPPV